MDVLILLIGDNPLPNYVVAKYLLIPNREDVKILPVPEKIIFLHSQKTEKVVGKLKKHLTSEIVTINLGDEERDPNKIRNAIKDELKNEMKSVHLNYTGGTKPMAVNAYAQVDTHKKEKIFSDLNPNNFKIHLVGNSKKYPVNGDLRDYVKLNFDELFEIHNLQSKRNFSENALSDEKIDWKERVKELKEKMDTIINREKPKNTKKQSQEPQGHRYREDGKTLEEFIYANLMELQEKRHIEFDSIYANMRPDQVGRDFEIDVQLIRGYQYFLISCTISSDIKIVKLKAFEAIYRAEQLGGEHAKSITISFLPDEPVRRAKAHLKNLSKDLSSLFVQGKCSILGAEDIQNIERLQNKLVEIIRR